MASTDERAKGLDVAGYGGLRVLGGVVFEDDVARVPRVPEDADDLREVRLLLRAALAANLGLDLDVDGVGCHFGKFDVGVRAVKVPGVEVDTEVRPLDRPDN